VFDPTHAEPPELLEPIGEGGMARVYRARHPGIPGEIAVKVPHPDRLTPVLRRRFEQESRILETLDGVPGVPAFHHTGVLTLDGHEVPYIAMELIDGPELRAEVGSGRLDRAAILEIIASLARTLHAAHERGVIHRDVKPENVRLTPDGPVLLDFGVGRLDAALEDEVTRITTVGDAPGTYLYMSPEQARGERDLDGRSDVYSLAVTAYEMLTGKLPYGDRIRSYSEIISSIAARPAIPPREFCADLDPDLESVLLRALEKDPDRSHPSAAAFADDLTDVIRNRRLARMRRRVVRLAARLRHSRRARFAAFAALVLLVGVLGYAVFTQTRTVAPPDPDVVMAEVYDQILGATGRIHSGRRTLQDADETIALLQESRSHLWSIPEHPAQGPVLALVQMRLAEACLIRAFFTGDPADYRTAVFEAKQRPNFQWSALDHIPIGVSVHPEVRAFGRHLMPQLQAGAHAAQARFGRPGHHLALAIEQLELADSFLLRGGNFRKGSPEHALADGTFRVRNELAAVYLELAEVTDSLTHVDRALELLTALTPHRQLDPLALASSRLNRARAYRLRALGRHDPGDLELVRDELSAAAEVWGPVSHPTGYVGLTLERARCAQAAAVVDAPRRDHHRAELDRWLAELETLVPPDVDAGSWRALVHLRARTLLDGTDPPSAPDLAALDAVIADLTTIVDGLDRTRHRRAVAEAMTARAECRWWAAVTTGGAEASSNEIEPDLAGASQLIDPLEYPSLAGRHRRLRAAIGS